MNRTIPEIVDPLDDLQSRLRQEKVAQRKWRLHMLVLLKSGAAPNRKAVAERLAVHRNTVSRWLSLYEAGGIEALLQIGSVGPHSGQRSLPEGVIQALSDRLKDRNGFSSYAEIQDWLQSTYSCKIKYHTLYRIVHHHLGAKPKVPRPSHIKK